MEMIAHITRSQNPYLVGDLDYFRLTRDEFVFSNFLVVLIRTDSISFASLEIPHLH